MFRRYIRSVHSAYVGYQFCNYGYSLGHVDCASCSVADAAGLPVLRVEGVVGLRFMVSEVAVGLFEVMFLPCCRRVTFAHFCGQSCSCACALQFVGAGRWFCWPILFVQFSACCSGCSFIWFYFIWFYFVKRPVSCSEDSPGDAASVVQLGHCLTLCHQCHANILVFLFVTSSSPTTEHATRQTVPAMLTVSRIHALQGSNNPQTTTHSPLLSPLLCPREGGPEQPLHILEENNNFTASSNKQEENYDDDTPLDDQPGLSMPSDDEASPLQPSTSLPKAKKSSPSPRTNTDSGDNLCLKNKGPAKTLILPSYFIVSSRLLWPEICPVGLSRICRLLCLMSDNSTIHVIKSK